MTRTLGPHRPRDETRAAAPYDVVVIGGPEDRQALEDLFRRSTVETRYRRFHHMVKEFPHAYLADLTCRPCPHLAVAARLREGEQAGSLVGLASAATSDPETAEIAVWVADEWQRRGIASALMRRLVELMRGAGIRTATALLSYDNGPARRLLHELAPEATVQQLDVSTMEVSIPLASPEPLASPAVTPSVSRVPPTT
jgi:GNAT superfamily N-acetyltransferase